MRAASNSLISALAVKLPPVWFVYSWLGEEDLREPDMHFRQEKEGNISCFGVIIHNEPSPDFGSPYSDSKSSRVYVATGI